VLADGDFTSLLKAHTEHVARWELPTDPFLEVLMRQGLAGMTLHLSGRKYDETVGFTLNLRQPAVNLFLTGDAARASVVGRAFEEGVKTVESSRLFVQSARADQPVVQSVIEVQGLDVLEVFEQYYARSEQSPARFFELSGNRFLLVQSLPDVDTTWLEGLDPARADEIDLSADEFLVRRVFRFQCGCSPTRMLEMLRVIYAADPDDLFRGEAGVETFCPRCGARWWIERDVFSASDPSDAPDA
jgi:molecular chaperone Hsp33